MNTILGVVLIVLGTILLVSGFFLATSANIGGETEAFVFQVVFIGLGLGCLVYGGICLHDDIQDRKLEKEEE
jgi:4-hydroxybenzoate polyprenyltransferase